MGNFQVFLFAYPFFIQFFHSVNAIVGNFIHSYKNPFNKIKYNSN
jgi:hypothetical protein